MENKIKKYELDRVQKELTTSVKLSWEDCLTQIKNLVEPTVEELKELRDNIVKGYDSLRDEKVDSGRLTTTQMNNLMLVTTFIDYTTLQLGGEV